MAATEKVFSEIKFLNFFDDTKLIGTFPYVPEKGQRNIGDTQKVFRADVRAAIAASFNEDTKTILVFLKYGVSAPVDFFTAEKVFMNRVGLLSHAGDILESRTVQGVMSNSACYEHAARIFAEWVGRVKAWQEIADDITDPEKLIDDAINNALNADSAADSGGDENAQ